MYINHQKKIKSDKSNADAIITREIELSLYNMCIDSQVRLNILF
jgi:hypothetical protein